MIPQRTCPGSVLTLVPPLMLSRTHNVEAGGTGTGPADWQARSSVPSVPVTVQVSVHVNPRRYVRLAQQCVRRGEYEPLPKQGD